MLFKQQINPQFRDADYDGLIGLCGCMRYFQDGHTYFMHSIGKGNDVIPEQYGAAWIYTQCHVKIYKKIGYEDPLCLQQWIQPYHRPLLLNLDTTIEQNGKLVACGRIETCVFDLNRQLPRRLSSIDFPDGISEEVENTIPAFLGLEKNAEGMEERYQKTVRVSDLDKSRHMNNLRYVEMFQDAYDSAFGPICSHRKWRYALFLSAGRAKYFPFEAHCLTMEFVLPRCIRMELLLPWPAFYTRMVCMIELIMLPEKE